MSVTLQEIMDDLEQLYNTKVGPKGKDWLNSFSAEHKKIALVIAIEEAHGENINADVKAEIAEYRASLAKKNAEKRSRKS